MKASEVGITGPFEDVMLASIAWLMMIGTETLALAVQVEEKDPTHLLSIATLK